MIITSESTGINGIYYPGGITRYYANLRSQEGWPYLKYQREMVLEWGVEPIPQVEYECLLDLYHG